MNKYQKERRKRYKEMQRLGLGYFQQKQVMKLCRGDLEKVDTVIAGVKALSPRMSLLCRVTKALSIMLKLGGFKDGNK